MFKDKNLVTFYTNGLADIPSKDISDPECEQTLKCVHGLHPLYQWTGVEAMRRTDFFVPAFLVAYNLFMNGVDRFYQLRSANPTQRKE